MILVNNGSVHGPWVRNLALARFAYPMDGGRPLLDWFLETSLYKGVF